LSIVVATQHDLDSLRSQPAYNGFNIGQMLLDA
jgi:hypothetical protein